MNYIIFKTDGSILTQNLEYYIQQGNSGDEIFVGWEDADEDDIAIAVFTLPNKQTNTIAGIYDTKTIIVDEEEQTFNGWTFTLTSAQTTYNGLLQMAIRINRNNQIVVSYPIGLIINETGVMPDTDSGVTIEELNSYLLQLERLSRSGIDFYEFDNSVDTLNKINERVGTDKVFAMSFNGEISFCVLKRNGSNFKLAVNNSFGYYISDYSVGSTIINNLQYTEFGVVANNYITLNGVSGTLTTEQLEKVKLGNCYIKLVSLNETLYLRPKYASSTSIHFENIQYNFNSQLSNYLFRKTYINVTLADGTYTGQYNNLSELESSGNKVTSLSSSSTNVQYPSAKAVFDALQNIIAVAEGKCKSYVLSNSYPISESSWSNYTVYDENGDVIATWADFQTLVGVRSLLNEQLKTQTAFNDTLSLAYVLTGSYPSFYFHRAENYFADAKTGDVLLVVEINVPDRWLEVSTNSITFNILETSKVDISNMVTTDTDQEITGTKTISATDLKFKNGYDSNYYTLRKNNEWLYITLNGNQVLETWSSTMHYTYKDLKPGLSILNLGSSNTAWKDLYLSGKIDLGTKVSGRTNTCKIELDNYDGIGLWSNGARVLNIYDNATYTAKPIFPNTTGINLGTSTARFATIFGNNINISGEISDGTASFTVASAYGTMFNYVNLTIGGASQLSYDELTTATYDSDTTISLATAPDGCAPEYKGILSSGNSSVTLTFTGVSNILCNDDNCVVVNGTNSTITLPANTTIEVSILNGKMVAINWAV